MIEARTMKQGIVDVEDEDFLSQVAAVEADALSAKRRKISTTTTTTTNSSEAKIKEDAEGAYTAALRGSRSLLFQQQSTSRANGGRLKVVVADNNVFANADSAGGGGSGGGGGSCFKCGKLGHWARDCDANSYGGGGDPSVPEKACPCGLGACLVLTANTDKNRGRKFYKCPLREENGGCGFFEWCDKSSGTDSTIVRSQNYTLNPSIAELSCPCGAGSCLILTAKTGKNIGQQFYRCPANQGSSCGFFKWCSDETTTADLSDSVNTPKVYKNMNEMSNKSCGVRSGSSCFKCGKDGHWAKDCLLPSLHSSADLCASSGTCYKCGKPGHWAKDCPSNEDARVRFRQ
uniref:Putative DNA topoisomerase 3-alpha n=1 Tax=Davidia involucrata TaxID=16924 RepID=A0A5B7BKW3_DAVIN